MSQPQPPPAKKKMYTKIEIQKNGNVGIFFKGVPEPKGGWVDPCSDEGGFLRLPAGVDETGQEVHTPSPKKHIFLPRMEMLSGLAHCTWTSTATHHHYTKSHPPIYPRIFSQNPEQHHPNLRILLDLLFMLKSLPTERHAGPIVRIAQPIVLAEIVGTPRLLHCPRRRRRVEAPKKHVGVLGVCRTRNLRDEYGVHRVRGNGARSPPNSSLP